MSEKQLEANRLNAQKSTGPRTPEGKAASSQNAVTHGLRARAVVLPGEDQQAFDLLLRGLRDKYQSQALSEDLLIHQAAASWWKLDRLAAIEQTAWREEFRAISARESFQRRREKLAEQNLEQELPLQDDLRLHVFWGSALDKLAMQQQRLERTFLRALRDLQRLQAARRRQPPVGQAVGQVPHLPGTQPRPRDPDPTPPPPPGEIPQTPAATPTLGLNDQNLSERNDLVGMPTAHGDENRRQRDGKCPNIAAPLVASS